MQRWRSPPGRRAPAATKPRRHRGPAHLALCYEPSARPDHVANGGTNHIRRQTRGQLIGLHELRIIGVIMRGITLEQHPTQAELPTRRATRRQAQLQQAREGVTPADSAVISGWHACGSRGDGRRRDAWGATRQWPPPTQSVRPPQRPRQRPPVGTRQSPGRWIRAWADAGITVWHLHGSAASAPLRLLPAVPRCMHAELPANCCSERYSGRWDGHAWLKAVHEMWTLMILFQVPHSRSKLPTEVA